MPQIAPYTSTKLGEKMMLRTEYFYADKIFMNRTDRDAKNHTAALDSDFFLNGTKTWFVAGYKYAHENAVADQFSNDAHSFRLRFNQRIKMGSDSSARLKFGWRYENRDYKSITPASPSPGTTGATCSKPNWKCRSPSASTLRVAMNMATMAQTCRRSMTVGTSSA